MVCNMSRSVVEDFIYCLDVELALEASKNCLLVGSMAKSQDISAVIVLSCSIGSTWNNREKSSRRVIIGFRKSASPRVCRLAIFCFISIACVLLQLLPDFVEMTPEIFYCGRAY